MNREEIEKKIGELETEFNRLNEALDILDGPRSFFGRFKRSFISRCWSFDKKLFDFDEGVYFVVYFWVVVILFLDVVVYVLLPVISFLLSFLVTGIGGQ